MNMNIGEFCWTELATNDAEKAKDFYGKTFGWQFKDIQVNEMTYTLIKKNDKEFGGIWRIPSDKQNEIPPHWMAYILVEDIATSVAKAKQNGATIIKDVMTIGEMGKMAIITDPTGAHIAMWQVVKKE